MRSGRDWQRGPDGLKKKEPWRALGVDAKALDSARGHLCRRARWQKLRRGFAASGNDRPVRRCWGPFGLRAGARVPIPIGGARLISGRFWAILCLGERGVGEWSYTPRGTGRGNVRRRISATFWNCFEISGHETTPRLRRSEGARSAPAKFAAGSSGDASMTFLV